MTWVETWSKGDTSRELEIIREESRERRKFSLIALFQNYHHNAFKFNLIYNIIRNQPTTLCLLQILRFQAHYYPSALASFTHNSAGVPIIITCTKADMIDDGNDMIARKYGQRQGRRMERTDRWDYASPSNDLLEMWVDFMNLNYLFFY